jgi:hypothetical protein
MSQYYNINGLKIRVSDHEPNREMRDNNDVELYVKSVDSRLLSIESQLENICDRQGYDIADFQIIIDEWEDGSYDENVFARRRSEEEEEEDNMSFDDFMNSYHSNYDDLVKNMASSSEDEKLKGHFLPRSARHPEIKKLSEITGVSQSYIKKYFNIR